MATTAFSTLVDRLTPSLLGCPTPLITKNVVEAAIRVCERTLLWRYAEPSFALTSGVSEYAYTKPANTEVHAVLMATVNNERLNVLTLDQATAAFPAYIPPDGSALSPGQPRAVTQILPDKFVILPLPDSANTYTVRMVYALRPTRTATEMDSVAFNELEEAIYHNVLQNLLVLPEATWSDRTLASYHAKQFIREVTERRARANLTNFRGTMVASAPRFA
jgi:hypothetical protein